MAARSSIRVSACVSGGCAVFAAGALLLWRPAEDSDFFWIRWLLIVVAGYVALYHGLRVLGWGLGWALRPRDAATEGTTLADGGRAYVASRWRHGALTLGCVAILAFFWFSLGLPNPVAAWIGLPVFALFGLGHALEVISPARLVLSRSGFEVNGSIGRRRSIAWRDIEPLFVVGTSSVQGVGYRYQEGRRPDLGWWRRLASRIGDTDGTLPMDLELEAGSLCRLMNEMRSRTGT
ncbi:MAG TPA: hypothetical protein VMT68_21150 [Caulobacteraceae bacterium]|nr:hypothetical protein [Caulobacteraceae bacterium]